MTKNEVDEISLKAFTHIFVEAQKSNRRFCFILGAGASREAGILTGTEMAKIWVDEIKEKYDEDEIESLRKKLKIESIEINSKNFFGIYDLRFFSDYQSGYAYFEHELEKGSPSIGHHALAKILADETNNLVITTNFDSLIEDALFIYTNKHPLVVGHESLTEFINLNIKRPIVAKVHRSLYFQPFNREKETASLAEGWKETLKNVFMVYTPIVVGYAGGDGSLMKFLQDKNTKLNGLYWCYWNKDEPSKEILSLVKSKNGCLVPIEGFDEMMFMLSRKLSFENPENEMRKVTQDRIDKYNFRYKEFEKKICQNKEYMKIVNLKVNEIIQETLKNNMQMLEKAEIKCEEQKTPLNYLKKGDINCEIGRYKEAVCDYTQAIALDNNNSSAYKKRGDAYFNIKKYSSAIEDYTEAIRINIDDAIVYRSRGDVYYSIKKYDKAIEDYTEAIRLMPNYVLAYKNRGFTYRAMGELEKAKADEDTAKSIN